MNFLYLLLKRLGPFLDWYDMLDYSHVIYLEVVIHPCEYISVLLEEENEILPLLRCAECTEIHKLQILIHSQINLFVQQCRVVGFSIDGSWKVVFQVIQLLK